MSKCVRSLGAGGGGSGKNVRKCEEMGGGGRG